jgi:hypothetical protein
MKYGNSKGDVKITKGLKMLKPEMKMVRNSLKGFVPPISVQNLSPWM